MKKHLLSTFILTTIMIFPIAVNAQGGETPIEKVIAELAEKPVHHQSLAKYYTEKAAHAEKELATHKSMRQAYMGYRSNDKRAKSMVKHCDNLISSYETLVNEYKEMAVAHESDAKNP